MKKIIFILSVSSLSYANSLDQFFSDLIGGHPVVTKHQLIQDEPRNPNDGGLVFKHHLDDTTNNESLAPDEQSVTLTESAKKD